MAGGELSPAYFSNIPPQAGHKESSCPHDSLRLFITKSLIFRSTSWEVKTEEGCTFLPVSHLRSRKNTDRRKKVFSRFLIIQQILFFQKMHSMLFSPWC